MFLRFTGLLPFLKFCDPEKSDLPVAFFIWAMCSSGHQRPVVVLSFSLLSPTRIGEREHVFSGSIQGQLRRLQGTNCDWNLMAAEKRVGYRRMHSTAHRKVCRYGGMLAECECGGMPLCRHTAFFHSQSIFRSLASRFIFAASRSPCFVICPAPHPQMRSFCLGAFRAFKASILPLIMRCLSRDAILSRGIQALKGLYGGMPL